MSLLLLFLMAPPQDSQSWERPQPRPAEEGRWLCWEYTGKGPRAWVVKEAYPLEYFKNHIPVSDSMADWYIQHAPKHSKMTAEVKPLGRLSDQNVFDVFYRLPSLERPLGKLILIGTRGLYRPVVWIDGDMVDELDDSEIAEFETGQVLGTRCRHRRSYYFEDYFVFDPVQRIPINLRVDERIETILSKMGWRAWIDGNFDLWTLTFRGQKWEGKGWFVVEFRLSKGRLIAKSIRYDPNPKPST